MSSEIVSHTSFVIVHQQQTPFGQDQRQSIIPDEKFIPNKERRVWVDDQFYHDKVSVFNNKTYSEVVEAKADYVQQPESQKRNNAEVPGPCKRINSIQATGLIQKSLRFK